MTERLPEPADWPIAGEWQVLADSGMSALADQSGEPDILMRLV
jgi:hypothetical protein